MEIDESNEATQQIATAKDYGIAVDFEDELSDEEREVNVVCSSSVKRQV